MTMLLVAVKSIDRLEEGRSRSRTFEYAEVEQDAFQVDVDRTKATCFTISHVGIHMLEPGVSPVKYGALPCVVGLLPDPSLPGMYRIRATKDSCKLLLYWIGAVLLTVTNSLRKDRYPSSNGH